MLSTPCHIVSDLHLGVAPSVTERLFEDYLASLPGNVRSLVINGDLFDFWFEWKSVIPRHGFRVLAALAAVAEAGVRVVYVAGNHDCWGGDVLRSDVGAEYQVGAWDGQIGPWRTRVEHGDGLRAVEDRKYRMIRPLMRSPTAMRLFRRLHPDTATRIALGSSSASRTYRSLDGGEGLRRIARETLAREPRLDLLVYGHSHVAALESVDDTGVFANAGSWLDAPTYLSIADDRIELLEWSGSAQSNRLDVVNRRVKEALPHP